MWVPCLRKSLAGTRHGDVPQQRRICLPPPSEGSVPDEYSVVQGIERDAGWVNVLRIQELVDVFADFI